MFENAEKFCEDKNVKYDLKKHIFTVKMKLKEAGV